MFEAAGYNSIDTIAPSQAISSMGSKSPLIHRYNDLIEYELFIN